MDFPRNAVTNVHKTENILFVQWTIYALSPSTNLSFVDKSDQSTDDQFDILQDAEFNLRRRGHHVLHDTLQSVLWYFDLSGPDVTKDPGNDGKEEVLMITSRQGLKRIAFGSLRASDLYKITAAGSQKSSSETTYDPLPNNLTVFNSNGSLGRQATKNPPLDHDKDALASLTQDIALIHMHIISAISMSLSYALAKTSRFIPLVSRLFLDTTKDTAAQSRSDCRELRSLRLLSLHVYWLPSGVLVTFISRYEDYMWIDVSKSWSIFYRSQGPTKAKLAPFGIPASVPCVQVQAQLSRQFTDSAAETSPSLGSGDFPTFDLQKWKKSITTILQHRGIHVPTGSQWLYVHLDSSADVYTNYVHSQSVTLWPAQLCFRRTDPNQLSANIREPEVWIGSDILTIDPLAHAEAWFLAKSDRKEMLEKQLQGVENQPQSKVNDSTSDDGDSVSGLFSPADRQTETQGLHGIYPTPPDGFPSQGQNMSAEQGPSDAFSARETTNPVNHFSGEYDIKNPGIMTSQATSGVGVKLGGYDDDLFGDMDSAMYVSNDLTEADLNFFDEPDDVMMSDALDVQSQLSTPVKQVIKHDSRSGHDTFRHSEAPMEEVSSLRKDPGPTLPIQSNLLVVSLATPADSPVDHHDSNQYVKQTPVLSSIVKTKAHSGAPKVHFAVDDEPQLLPPVVCQVGEKQGMFGFIPLGETTRPFDDKYASEGKFSINVPDDEGGENDRDYHAVKQLPTIDRGRRWDEEESDLGTGSDEDSDEAFNPTSQVSSPYYDPASSTNGMTTDTDSQLKRKGDDESPKDIVLVDADANSPEVSSPTPISYDLKLLPLRLLLSNLESIMYEDPKKTLVLGKEQTSRKYSGHGELFINLAQIVADQMAFYAEDEGWKCLSTCAADSPDARGLFIDPLAVIMPRYFSRSEQCDLEICASISSVIDAPIAISKAMQRPPQRKNDFVRNNSASTPSTSIFKILAPDLRVRRGDILMDVSATALHFWEELGLSPCHGPKTIRAFCVYPHTTMILRGVESFLSMLSCTYQSLKLGMHFAGSDLISELPGGLVPVTMNSNTPEGTASAIDSACEKLGELISSSNSDNQTIVVYIVNPFGCSQDVPRLCASFMKLIEQLPATADIRHPVLKIIRMSWVASKSTVALPSPKQYIQLANEMYDRCPAGHLWQEASVYDSSSLFRLTPEIPKTLAFKLSAGDTSSSLLSSNTSFHIAYSWATDLHWLSISMTDNLGTRHYNASYSLGPNIDNPWLMFKGIANDIWETFLDVLDTYRGPCQVFIVKDQLMAQEEIEAWLSVSTRRDQLPISLVLVDLDISPPVHYSHEIEIPSSPSEEQASYATPGSTPLATPRTPDNLASPGLNIRPSYEQKIAEAFESDSTARLIEVSDETWGVICARNFPPEMVGVDQRPVLANGYLVKRRGVTDSDGWTMLDVRVVHAEKWPGTILKELLYIYRSLGTLAKARGIEDPVESVLPWHVAVARKSQLGLSRTMRYEPG